MAEKEKQQKNMGLDLLRVFACLWVVAVHLEQNISMPAVLRTFCQRGSTGVDIFFVLTGFLAYKSLDMVRGASGCNRAIVIAYWKKRAIRILPAYYAVILFYGIYFSVLGKVPVDETGWGWFRYLFLLNQWIPSTEVFWTNIGAVWSVSVFALFYLLVPFYYCLVRKFSVSLIGMVVFYVLAKVVGVYVVWMQPLRFLYLFAIGITVYLAIKEEKAKLLVALFSGAVLILLVYDAGIAIWPAFLTAIFIAVSDGIKIKNVIIKKGIMIVSKYSYTVYLVHVAVFEVLLNHRPQSDIIYVSIFALSTVIGSLLVYYLVENPVRILGMKRNK